MAAKCWILNTNNAAPNNGFYFSVDNGQTWTLDTTKTIPTTLGVGINGFRVVGSAWVFQGNSTIYVSTNAGVSWTARGIAVTPTTIYLDNDVQVISDGNNIYVSSDNFATFSTFTSAGAFNGYNPIELVRNSRTGNWILIARNAAPSLDVYTSPANGLSWTRHVTPISDSNGNVPNTANKNLGWASNGAYLVYLTTVGGHFGVTFINDSGGATKTLDGVGAPTTGIALLPCYNSTARFNSDMYIHEGVGSAHSSPTGIAPWTSFAGLSDAEQPCIVRMDDGAYIETSGWKRSTNLGVSWAPISFGGLNAPTTSIISYEPHDLISAPAERPHFIDRGLPIEIAGPRNDITRRAYLPNVRLFGS